MKREFILKLHKEFCRSENLVISVFGEVEPERIKKVVEEAFGKLPRGKPKS
jgi:predicted Zn-dependent peptidase